MQSYQAAMFVSHVDTSKAYYVCIQILGSQKNAEPFILLHQSNFTSKNKNIADCL